MSHKYMVRLEVDPAVRVLLPHILVLVLVKGIDFATVTQAKIDASPFLAHMDKDVPLAVWGWCYIGFGVLLAASLLTRRRDLCMAMLSVVGAWLALMTVAYVQVALSVQGVSGAPWIWPATGAAACLAAWSSLAGDTPWSILSASLRGSRDAP